MVKLFKDSREVKPYSSNNNFKFISIDLWHSQDIHYVGNHKFYGVLECKGGVIQSLKIKDFYKNDKSNETKY